MKEMTREEIDRRLENLRSTRNKEDSFVYNRPAIAMCYAMRPIIYDDYNIKLFCPSCNEKITLKIKENSLNSILAFYDKDTILEIEKENPGILSESEYIEMKIKRNPERKELLERMLESTNKMKLEKQQENKDFVSKKIKGSYNFINVFRNLGLDAKLEYNCEKCSNIESGVFYVCVKAKDEKEWHKSIPQSINAWDMDNTTTNFEYQLVVDFLSKKEGKKVSEKDLSKVFDKIYNDIFIKKELSHFEDVKKIDFGKIKDFTYIKGIEVIDKELERLYIKHNEGKIRREDEHKYLLYRFQESYNQKRPKEKLLYNDIYDFDDRYGKAGLIKTQIDFAIQKVLGFEIYYTKDEIKKNIGVVLKEEKEEKKIPYIFKVLEDKNSKEFDSFMKCFYDSFLRRKVGISKYEFDCNFFKYYKEGIISEKDYREVVEKTYELINNQAIRKFDSKEEFEKEYQEKPNFFVSFIEKVTEKLYKNFIKEKAKELDVKTYDEFIGEFEFKNNMMSLKKYIEFMDGID